MRSPSRRAALAAIVILNLVVAVLPYVALYPPAHQHRMYPLAPPTVVHFDLTDGVFVCALAATDRFGEYREDCTTKYPLNVLRSSTAGDSVRLIAVDEPAAIFLMGTDELGRDVASQFLVGARQSLFAAEAATVLALLIALVAGTIGGYLGGLVDRLFVRAGDIIMALPWLYAILALRGALPLSVDAGSVTLLTILLLALVGWVRPARVFRAIVASTSTQGYVQAAAGFGAPATAIVVRHLWPAVAGAALTQAVLLIPQFLLAEVALSVLGVLGDSASGWGPLVAALQRYAIVSAAWWLALPAVLIVGVLLLFHKLADTAQGHLRVTTQRG